MRTARALKWALDILLAGLITTVGACAGERPTHVWRTARARQRELVELRKRKADAALAPAADPMLGDTLPERPLSRAELRRRRGLGPS